MNLNHNITSPPELPIASAITLLRFVGEKVVTPALPIQSQHHHEHNKSAGTPQTNPIRGVLIGRASMRRAATPCRIPLAWPAGRSPISPPAPHTLSTPLPLPLSHHFSFSHLVCVSLSLYFLLGLSTRVEFSPQNCRHYRRRAPNVSGICTASYNLRFAGRDSLSHCKMKSKTRWRRRWSLF
jgi:hypothetical protein